MSLEGTHTVWKPQNLSIFFIHGIHKFLLLFTMLSSMFIIHCIPIENDILPTQPLSNTNKNVQKDDTPDKNNISKQNIPSQEIRVSEVNQESNSQELHINKSPLIEISSYLKDDSTQTNGLQKGPKGRFA